MNRTNSILIVLVAVPLIVVVGVLRYQQGARQESNLQQLRESEHALRMKANPLPYVRKGAALQDVEKVLGTGERVVHEGEDLAIWYGAGDGKLWTLVATIKDGKVSRHSVMQGTDADHHFRKQMAISLHRPRGEPPAQNADERKKAEPMPNAGVPEELKLRRREAKLPKL